MTAFATSIFCIAAILFLLNFALGLLVQFHLVDTKPFRWLHHALFFAVFVSVAAAALAGFLSGAPYRWPLVPIIFLFVVLPLRARRYPRPRCPCLRCLGLLFFVGLVSML